MTDNDQKQNGTDTAAASESVAPESQPAAAPATEALTPEAEIARLTEENAKLRDQMLRALADAENTRRRTQREREDMAKYAISDFAKELLAVADNLRRALEAVPENERRAESVLANLAEGVSATERQLLSAFEKNGIVKIDPVDQKFDPNYHQAMFEVIDSGKLPGTVAQVIQPGYVLHGRLLRPALVGVAKGEPPPKVDTVA